MDSSTYALPPLDITKTSVTINQQAMPTSWNVNKKNVILAVKSGKMDTKGFGNKESDMRNEGISTKDYIDARQNSYEKSIDDKVARIENTAAEIKQDLKDFKSEIIQSNKSVKVTVITTAISSTFALAGIVLGTMYALPSFFEMGKNFNETVAAAVSAGNAELKNKVNDIGKNLNESITSNAELKNKVDDIGKTLNENVTAINKKNSELENKINELDSKFSEINDKLDKLLKSK